ncbi:uncharacterized protein LOC133197165 isoform X1 [Saccostrea echinata]|uniref:uncharacterized protein LOC133197165 isoform X1 n=1 Tax=Saccostrea echinata TaxID=191078 RepID=UPI002A80BDD4|nr:uncharacterized protein LOC133197165 isoform X1 [Saccostrea echinata]
MAMECIRHSFSTKKALHLGIWLKMVGYSTKFDKPFNTKSGIENRQSFHKNLPKCSQDDSIVSYGHYDTIARKSRCLNCCDREIERKYWSDRSYNTRQSHHRTNKKCLEKWITFIQSSKMVRLGGRILLFVILVSVFGIIFGGSFSSRVSDSDKIHLGEEAKLVMHKIQPVGSRVFHEHVKNVSKYHMHNYHDMLRIFFKNPSDKEIDLFLKRKTLKDILPEDDFSKRDYNYVNDEAYYPFDPLDLADQAEQHYTHVLDHPYSSCHEPKPEVIYIPPEGHKKFIPEYTILHRCRNTTGCCWDKSQTCAVKNLEIVTRSFFVVDMLSDDTIVPNEVEQQFLINHTSCHCQLINPQPGCDQQCPHPFRKVRAGDTCTCECRHDRLPCLEIKWGIEPLSTESFNCVKEKRCMQPTCQDGQFDMRKGFCPGTNEPYPYRKRRNVQR